MENTNKEGTWHHMEQRSQKSSQFAWDQFKRQESPTRFQRNVIVAKKKCDMPIFWKEDLLAKDPALPL
jgi:hypothetical protein